jgi:hypothetical protein
MEFKLNKAGFKAWLKSLPPNAFVGVACDDAHCPIARHIRIKTRTLKHIGVDSDTYVIGDTSKLMPEWASRFVAEVDRFKDDTGNGRKVKAREALCLLK